MRGGLQARMAPLAASVLTVVWLARRFGNEPGVVPFAVAYGGVAGAVSIREIVRYRRLKAQLGLEGEYDQVDEDAQWGAKLLLMVFGGGAAFFVLLFWFISAFGKR